MRTDRIALTASLIACMAFLGGWTTCSMQSAKELPQWVLKQLEMVAPFATDKEAAQEVKIDGFTKVKFKPLAWLGLTWLDEEKGIDYKGLWTDGSKVYYDWIDYDGVLFEIERSPHARNRVNPIGEGK